QNDVELHGPDSARSLGRRNFLMVVPRARRFDRAGSAGQSRRDFPVIWRSVARGLQIAANSGSIRLMIGRRWLAFSLPPFLFGACHMFLQEESTRPSRPLEPDL